MSRKKLNVLLDTKCSSCEEEYVVAEAVWQNVTMQYREGS